MKKSHVKFNGSILQRDIYDACYFSLRSYPILKKIRESLSEIDGCQNNFVDKILEKLDLDQQIALMEEAFANVPEKYLPAVRYLLFTDDTYAEQRDTVTYRYGKDYQEVIVWVEKLIYQYAVLYGWPVTQRVEEITMVTYEDGRVELR